MIYRSKGKYHWNRKATYSVDWSLTPLIHSYLVKLKESLESAKTKGVPMYYMESQAKIQGLENGYDENVSWDEANNLRMKDLNELIWAFDKNSEPQIEDYDFTYNFCNNGVKCSNEEERDRYHKDQTEWWERKQEALKLFGEIYQTLDW